MPGEDEIDTPSIVEDGDQPPGWGIALQAIAIVPLALGRDRRTANCRGAGRGSHLWIGPCNAGHPSLLVGVQLDVIGAPVGVDDEIGGDVGAGGFHEDMDALGATRAAGGVADDPARGVARRDRAGAGQAFARFERNIRDLPGCSIDLVERAFAPRKNLHGVVIALLAGFDPGDGIGGDDARFRRIRFRIAATEGVHAGGV